MDEYTRVQREWLDSRFQLRDEDGYYLTHQPIYGFRVAPSEPGHTFRYTITNHILQALGPLEFETFLDAGGGEGYKAYLLKRLWETKSTLSDLSEQACHRAREIFSLTAVTSDLHDMPFQNEAFDVVLCSESLEHVDNYQNALNELLRVARKVLIITVPHEDHSEGQPDEPHGHINTFTKESLNFLRDCGYHVEIRKMLSPLLTVPASLADATPRSHNPAWKHPRMMTACYNALVPLARKVFGLSAVSFLIWLDSFLCRWTPWHNGLLYIVTKDRHESKNRTSRKVPIREVLDITVPKHKLEV